MNIPIIRSDDSSSGRDSGGDKLSWLQREKGKKRKGEKMKGKEIAIKTITFVLIFAPFYNINPSTSY
jgi:hypothetical protein